MFAPIIEFFERLLTDFSWRRLALAVGLIGLGVAAVSGYEWYTAAFRLARIEKQVGLVERMAKLKSDTPLADDKRLHRIVQALTRDLRTTVPVRGGGLSPWATKMLAAAVPWVLLAILTAIFARQGLEAKALGGMIVVALPFVLLAAALPISHVSWINYVAYPWGHMLVIVVAILLWQRQQMRRLAAATTAAASVRQS